MPKLIATVNLGYNHLPSPVKAGETFECDETSASICVRDGVARLLDNPPVPKPAVESTEEAEDETPRRRRRRRTEDSPQEE